jgi:hypothetical protein
MPAELDVAQLLIVYGPLGIFNVFQAFAIRALFKRMGEREEAYRAEQAKREAAYDSVITKLEEAHRTEMVALSDRHLVATNTWTQHYQTWAERATAVLEALYRRAGRR